MICRYMSGPNSGSTRIGGAPRSRSPRQKRAENARERFSSILVDLSIRATSRLADRSEGEPSRFDP